MFLQTLSAYHCNTAIHQRRKKSLTLLWAPFTEIQIPSITFSIDSLYSASRVQLTFFALWIAEGPFLPIFAVDCQSPIFTLKLPCVLSPPDSWILSPHHHCLCSCTLWITSSSMSRPLHANHMQPSICQVVMVKVHGLKRFKKCHLPLIQN